MTSTDPKFSSAQTTKPTDSKAEAKEDYAEERVPTKYRTWTRTSLFGVMFGITTAMIFLSWGGVMVRQFGTANLVVGMVLATVVIGGLATFFAYRASRTGLGAELLTRRSFGFLGSIPAALIYGFALIMYFAFEGGIMVSALTSYFSSVPRTLMVLLTAAAMVPLALYGMKVMNVVMWATLPIYLVFMIYTIVRAATDGTSTPFWSYVPETVDTAAGPAIVQILAAAIGYTTQISLSADSGRFIRPAEAKGGAVLIGGISQLLVFMGVTLLGAWLALRFEEADPGIYLPALMGIWGVLFVIVTQFRINVVNIYGSSIALANAFTRITKVKTGRHIWVLISIAIGTVAMLFDLYGHLTSVMTFAGVFLLAWVMTVFSEHLWTRWVFKWVDADHSPYLREELPAVNPIGLVSVIAAILVGTPLALGLAGPLGVTLAPFIAGIIPLVVVPLVARRIGRRFYGITFS